MKISFIIFIILLILTGCSTAEKINEVKSLPLMQTRWEIQSINSVKIDSSRIYLLFEDDGKLRGNAGCNSLGGKYEASAGNIILTNIITTKMACPDLDKENLFLRAIQKSETYKILGSTLTISGADNTKIIFTSK